MMTTPPISLVMYCLIRRRPEEGQPERFLLIEKQGHAAFPPTKYRPGENLYAAMERPMAGDLGLPEGSYFPEVELPVIANAGESPRYPGLNKRWWLFPVTVSLNDAGWEALERLSQRHWWWTLDEVLERAKEPNILIMARLLKDREDIRAAMRTPPVKPSMDALACHWAAHASHELGVRIVTDETLERILDAGDRAFNLRVADPYLPYQRQGLGFTWSFFTSEDKQDIHVHALPAVEIYGVIKGRMQLWYKSMGERGVRVWRCRTLGPGDWAEVEPLVCHFVCWCTPEGLATVIKAAASGDMAGVGRLGVAGKTTCQWVTPDGRKEQCANYGQCTYPPALRDLEQEFHHAHANRDWKRIAVLTKEAQEESA